MEEPPSTPTIGLLTRTLSDSPVVRWILPLSFQNNLLYVGEDFVHRYECSPYGGYVSHVESLPRIGSKILAAAVMRDAHSDYDILLLTLDDGIIISIKFGLVDDRLQIELAGSHALPRTHDPLQKVGKFLAVENSSKAIAVAAHERGLILLGAVPGLPSLVNEAAILDHTHILQMEFLHTPSKSANSMTLLLVKLISKKLVIQRLEWSSHDSNAKVRTHDSQRINLDGALPDLLIPLKSSGMFILAASTGLFLFQHIFSGHAEQQKLRFPKSNNDSASKSGCIWVSWASHPTMDSVMVFRDDGLVVRFDAHAYASSEAYVAPPLSVSHISVVPDFRAVQWSDTADENDIVILYGTSGEGAVYKVFTKHEPDTDFGDLIFDRIQTLPSWATALDLVCSKLPRSNESQLRALDGLFITSGTDSRGQITELRPGLEAHLIYAFDLGAEQTRSDLWITPFPDDQKHMVFLLSEHDSNKLAGTRAIWFDDEGVEIVDHSDMEDNTDIQNDLKGLTLNASTINVSATTGGILLTTRTAVTRIVDLASEAETIFSVQDGTEIVAFDALDNTSNQSIVIITSQTSLNIDDYATLHYMSLRNPGHSQSVSLPGCITAVKVLSWESEELCALATSSGELLIRNINTDSPLAVHKFAQSADITTTAESVLLAGKIGCEGQQPISLRILCSLRNGTVEVLLLEHGNGSKHITLLETITLGVTSVIMTPMLAQSDDIFLTACGSNLHVVTVSQSSKYAKVEQLWTSDRDEPSFQHENISAILQVRHHLPMAGNDLYGALLIVMGSRFLIASLQKQVSHAVPRSIIPQGDMQSGYPVRLMYSSVLSHFVVATVERQQIPSTSDTRQYYRSIVEYQPPQRTASDKADERPVQALLQAGERVYSLAEWTYRSAENKRYVFTLVGTGIESKTHGSGPHGRIHILQPTLRRRRVEGVVFANKLKFDHPVYALAMYSDTILIVGFGSNLSCYQYSPTNRKWTSRCTYLLGSPAVSITCSTTSIHVATAGNSLVCFALRLPNAESITLHPLAADAIQASCLHHISDIIPPNPIANSSIHILATKSAHLRGLVTPASAEDHLTTAQCLFSARLPRSITRLRAMDTSLDPLVTKHSIVGLATDGALYGLALLDAHDWARLKYVETLVRRDKELGKFELRNMAAAGADVKEVEGRIPLGLAGLELYAGETEVGREARTGYTGAEDVRMEDDGEVRDLDAYVVRARQWRAEDMHVDGDVLARLDGEEGIEKMLERVLRKVPLGQDDRIGRFVAERLEEEVALVPKVAEIVRRCLKEWGFW
ncbi:hypothetical protein K461DRAFT_292940 [Myriangium duriaei CBS 260.36]|uniref:RSE1/DDB1/CPSF1 first beta-propeller domain-containing protein n=1 Tax=Myriangium duriaei CBS 260.36 TaxID=1168546 RepID=A0A9P4J361_9PEZI|nr:hypothetical protein K461DRAFT_292940 [Myriangium duriaei CBS 260.36]